MKNSQILYVQLILTGQISTIYERRLLTERKKAVLYEQKQFSTNKTVKRNLLKQRICTHRMSLVVS